MKSDVYLTIQEAVCVEADKVKGSRFIAHAFPFESSSFLSALLEQVRGEYPGASHYCWAYRLGIDGAETRYSDDGEPGGTAGIPILRQLEGRDLVKTLVVVTRYFGGTKLGKGGLIRAYGSTASEVLNQTPLVERILRVPVAIRFDYPDTSPVMQLLSRYDTKIDATRYGEQTEIVVLVRKSQLEEFRNSYRDALSARGVLTMIEQDF